MIFYCTLGNVIKRIARTTIYEDIPCFMGKIQECVTGNFSRLNNRNCMENMEEFMGLDCRDHKKETRRLAEARTMVSGLRA